MSFLEGCLSAVQERSGKISMMRFLLFIVTLVVLCMWIIACAAHKILVEIPPGVLGLVTVFTSGKLIQRSFENGTPANVTTDVSTTNVSTSITPVNQNPPPANPVFSPSVPTMPGVAPPATSP